MISIAQSVRPVPIHLEPVVEDLLEELASRGIIRVEGPARWQSPIHLVKKKDGGVRMTVDMHQANRAVIKETYPMHPKDALAAKLDGAKVFSKMDIREAFWQIRLDESAQEITTFCTHRGLYQFKVLPFELNV